MADRGTRLHWSSPVFDLMSSARSLVFVGVAVLFASRGGGSNVDIVIGVVVGIAAALQAVRYFVTWYRLDGADLVVSRGLFFRNERHVPYGRIQNLDLKRGPLHRMLGVAEVRLQTASGSEPEAVLRVLSAGAIDRLREGIGRGRTEESGAEEPDGRATPGEAPEVVVRLDMAELVRLGLVSNRSLVVVGAVVGFMWQFDLKDPVEHLFEDAEPVLAGMSLGAAALLAIGSAVFLVALMLVLSVAWAIVRFYAFRLERVGEEFRIRCGLLTEYSGSVVRERVQLVSVRQSPLARLAGRVSIRVETAGGVSDGDQMLTRRHFVPILPASRAHEIVAMVFPGVSVDDAEWRALATGATRRMLKKAIITWGLIGVVIGVTFWPWGAVAMAAIVPVVAWHTVRAARRMGWARQGEAILFRSGVWIRKTSVTLEDRVQVVSVRENPFDRRHGHASLALDTAGAGPAGHAIAVPYLEAAEAGRLRRAIASRVEVVAG